MRRVLGLVVVALVVLAGRAGADGDAHTHQPVVLGIEPEIDGLTVEVRPEPAPTLVVRNATGATVEVLHDGRPFLRIGPTTVDADASSPEFYRSESPSPAADVPPSANGGEPRFVRLVDGADWAWFEHRILATPIDETWHIPIRVDGVDAEIVGRWEAVPVPAQVISTIDPIDVDGLTVEVLPGRSPGLYVRNDTGEAFVVDDVRGEPFLTIGPERTTRATLGGEPEVVAPTPSYGWIDPRIGWRGVPPHGRSRRAWELPVRLGDRDLVLTGIVEWIRIDEPDDGGVPLPAVGAGVVALAALTFAVARKVKRT